MRALASALLSASILAAESRVDGPTIGVLLDETSGDVRIVKGIPGSATVSPAVANLKLAAISANGAVGIAGDHLAAYNLETRTVRRIGIDAAPDKIAVSANGNFAAIAEGSRIRVIGNVLHAPVESDAIGLPAGPALLAIADDGAELLASVSESNGTALYRNGERIAFASRVQSMIYAADSHDAVLAAGDNVMVLRGDALGVLATLENLITAVPSKGAIHAAAGRKIRSFSEHGAVIGEVECPCEIQALEPIGASAFRLTRNAEGPTWIFDAGERRVTFIPGASHE